MVKSHEPPLKITKSAIICNMKIHIASMMMRPSDYYYLPIIILLYVPRKVWTSLKEWMRISVRASLYAI